MNRRASVVWLAAGILSLMVLGSANLAEANHFNRKIRHQNAARQEIFQDRREIHRDRAELRGDLAELNRDRAELRRSIRRGASPAEIARRNAEVQQDFREIGQDRRELREDYAELRRDLDKYGWNDHRYGRDGGYGYWGNRGWVGDHDRYGWLNRNRYGWGNRDRFDRWDHNWWSE